MNARERFLTAMDHKQADRIPMFDFLFQQNLFQEVLGHRPETYNFEDAVNCTLQLGLDGVWIPTDGFGGYSPEAVSATKYKDEWGTINQKTEYSWPIDPPVEFPIKDWEDFKNWTCPVADDPHRVQSIKDAIKMADGRIAVLGGVTGPFTILFMLMGMENACLCSLTEPDLFHAIMRVATDYNKTVGLNLIEAGADAVIISEDLGYNTGTFLSPETTRTMVLPYVREMAEAYKKTGTRVMLHCDGNMNGIMDDLAHLGIDAWQPVERKGHNDLGFVKEHYGKILTPIGNVDSSTTLPFGTKEDVERQTIECMRVAGEGGGYILGSDHSLHDGIPVENIFTMIDTCHKYGEYPLKLPATVD